MWEMRKIVLEFNACKASLKKYVRVLLLQAKRAEKFSKNWHLFLHSSKVKVRLLIFCSDEDINIFSAFL